MPRPSRLCPACNIGLVLSTLWDAESLAEVERCLDNEDKAIAAAGYDPEPRDPRRKTFKRNAEDLNPLRCAHCKASFKGANALTG